MVQLRQRMHYMLYDKPGILSDVGFIRENQKVDRFETLPEATAHRQKHGGEVRELVFCLSEVRTLSQRTEGWVRADGDYLRDSTTTP